MAKKVAASDKKQEIVKRLKKIHRGRFSDSELKKIAERMLGAQ